MRCLPLRLIPIPLQQQAALDWAPLDPPRRYRPLGLVKVSAGFPSPAFSSNYALYADMSNRVVEVLSAYTPNLEVYSIDESFLDLSCFTDRDLIEYGQQMRQRIFQWLGLPVCVGIAPSKTLAKLANHIAKKRAEFDGVCDLT